MTPAPQSRKMHSVFFTIFFSLLLALVIELTLLIGTIVVGQVPSQLDDNAEEVLCEQVENRSGYLQNFLVSSQELTALSTYINSQTEALLADGPISLDTLDSGSAASAPLLPPNAPAPSPRRKNYPPIQSGCFGQPREWPRPVRR